MSNGADPRAHRDGTAGGGCSHGCSRWRPGPGPTPNPISPDLHVPPGLVVIGRACSVHLARLRARGYYEPCELLLGSCPSPLGWLSRVCRRIVGAVEGPHVA